MRHDGDGDPFEVGRRTRTIPPALRRALLHRDRGCHFPGCGRAFCQGHHLRHWANGGPTTLANLAQVERRPDGELRFRRPDGRPIPEAPSPVAVPADPVGALRALHRAQGLALHARTLTPSWLGERLDLGWALDVLHPLATRGG
jgi:hypothetical protein